MLGKRLALFVHDHGAEFRYKYRDIMIEVSSVSPQSLHENVTLVIRLCHDSWFVVLPFCAICSELLNLSRNKNDSPYGDCE